MDYGQEQSPTEKRDTLIRALALATLYSGALLLSILFAPALGLVPAHPVGDVGMVAATPAARH